MRQPVFTDPTDFFHPVTFCCHNPRRRLHGLRAVFVSLLMVFFALPGCTFLPSSGPSGFRIKAEAGQTKGQPTYELLQVDQPTMDMLKRFSPAPAYLSADGQELDTKFLERGIETLGQGSSQTIRPGDIVHVAIFESGGGLFSPLAPEGQSAGSPVTSLPAQRVDQQGDITVPYAGRVRALGRLPGDLESEITALLRGKTVDPQVIVTVAKRDGGDLVSVGGDV
jgi:polysaccharide export outer membrane protein